MKTSIATVSISGNFAEKLEAIAAAGFHGLEIFEQDFIAHDGGTGCSSPVAGTSNQLTLCNHWIQHTSVHCNKAHIGQ